MPNSFTLRSQPFFNRVHEIAPLIDPLPQLRKWIGKVIHVHGKDASIYWNVVLSQGIFGPTVFVQHRTPGFGETDWVQVVSELRRGVYQGSIDIEGWHDPVTKDVLEMNGQVQGNVIERKNALGFGAVEEDGIKFYFFYDGLIEGNLIRDNDAAGIRRDSRR